MFGAQLPGRHRDLLAKLLVVFNRLAVYRPVPATVFEVSHRRQDTAPLADEEFSGVRALAIAAQIARLE